MIACTDDLCRAARPEACRACQARLLFKDTKTVSIRSLDGHRAAAVRVIWPDGSWTQDDVTEDDR